MPQLATTVGCHPTRCGQFEQDAAGPEAYLDALRALAHTHRAHVVAIGECGLGASIRDADT
jgi:TatD DNase family protein